MKSQACIKVQKCVEENCTLILEITLTFDKLVSTHNSGLLLEVIINLDVSNETFRFSGATYYSLLRSIREEFEKKTQLLIVLMLIYSICVFY